MIELKGIGILYDFSTDLEEENYGQILSMLQDDTVPERCHEFSKEYFSLELGVSKYRQIYNNL